MTVFLAHAPADRQAAEALEVVIERRGQFVELDDGQVALRPVGSGDVLVLLISQSLAFATARLRIHQRALDAWAAGRLVLVKLDDAFAPVGLRDLPAIDASFEAQREFVWMKVADAVRDRLNAPSPQRSEEEAEDSPSPPASVQGNKRGPSWLRALALVALALPGVLAFYAAVSMWLVNRVGPAPGGIPDLLESVEQFGARFGAPAGVTPWLFGAAVALTVCVFAVFVAGIVKAVLSGGRRRAQTHSEATQPVRTDAVFVSYARANQGIVLPLIDAAKRAGRKFWVDQKGGVNAGDGWAGEIVRAIRSAADVMVMCSKAAFESDHVKREIYLADRYKKRLVPVFIEHAEPPEDFEYFFAGVQSLNLFETPEAERSQALMQVLGAAA
jgi:hypothetical protein